MQMTIKEKTEEKILPLLIKPSDLDPYIICTFYFANDSPLKPNSDAL